MLNLSELGIGGGPWWSPPVVRKVATKLAIAGAVAASLALGVAGQASAEMEALN